MRADYDSRRDIYLKAPVILGAVIVRYIQSVSGELDPLQYGILGARARRNQSLLHAMINQAPGFIRRKQKHTISSQDQ